MMSQDEKVAIAMHAILREWGMIHPRQMTEDHTRFPDLVRELQGRLNPPVEPGGEVDVVLWPSGRRAIAVDVRESQVQLTRRRVDHMLAHPEPREH